MQAKAISRHAVVKYSRAGLPTCSFWVNRFFFNTVFQFGLSIAPNQNTGLITAIYSTTLYGTTNRIILYMVQQTQLD